MRVTAHGCYFMKGTGKTGNAYDMAKLICRARIENVATVKMQKGGYGYEFNELDVDPGAVSKFNFDFPPEGLELDLEVDSVVRFGRLQSMIVGCKKVVPVAAISSKSAA